MNSRADTRPPTFFSDGQSEVVEVPLLLPTRRLEELVAMSRRRGISVAQILRQLIDQAIAAETHPA